MTNNNIKFFQPIPTTCEELKKAYRALAFLQFTDDFNYKAVKVNQSVYNVAKCFGGFVGRRAGGVGFALGVGVNVF